MEKHINEISKNKIISSIPISFFAYYLIKEKTNNKIIITPTLEVAKELVNAVLSISPKKIIYLPNWNFTPSIKTQAKRIRAIYDILNTKEKLIITTPEAINQIMPESSYVLNNSINIKKETEIESIDFLISKLLIGGYERSDLVKKEGSFSLRGNILDIFNPINNNPVRIEFFGDFIESIKIFDINTQRTKEKIENFLITPIREISLYSDFFDNFKNQFKKYCDDLGIKKNLRDQVISFAENKIYFPNIEFYLPFFFKKLITLRDLIDEDFKTYTLDDYLFQNKNLQINSEIPYPPLQLEEISKFKIDKKFYSTLFLTTEKGLELNLKKFNFEGKNLIEEIKNHHKNYKKVIYTSTNISQAKRIQFLVKEIIKKEIPISTSSLIDVFETQEVFSQILISNLKNGFTDNNLSILTEFDLFGKKQKEIQKSDENIFLKIFQELKVNDYVTHSIHGIGIYKGLEKIEIDGKENDFFKIEYANNDILFVPIYKLDSVQKYISKKKKNIYLDKLGSNKWSIKKAKAKKSTEDLAHELLKIHAERLKKKGFSFSKNDSNYFQFESLFEFQETKDQEKAIKDVLADMESDKPMDRLICGDVGFGKTEVALRASFKAVSDGKQVMILAPTTILSFQHYQVFKKRFKNYPVEIALLNRFIKKSDQKNIIEKFEKGKIDILIGTHRLLNNDIISYDLGLLIIDEEQKFGVKHKEKIKDISKGVDILMLSATPIPRTLNLAMVGLKDISLMSTPPINRLPIKTIVAPSSDLVIKKAIEEELLRGGQVFFLHNRVKDLALIEKEINKILPNIKIITVHGKNTEHELEKKMTAFYNKEADVLLCTSIIESGLDIPNTNTIIINRADMLGLSQLYQIRGRVGRSYRQAYCYLMLPTSYMFNKTTLERIKILQEFTELGSGFNIASFDLEFRGTGELLGEKQSGFIDGIGLEEYLRLLEESIKEAKGEKVIQEENIEIITSYSSFIPEVYIKNIPQRLYFYKKLSKTQTEKDILEIKEEIEDQYGAIPIEVDNLLNIIKIKQKLIGLGIESVNIGKNKITYKFKKENNLLINNLIELVTNLPKKYKILPDMKLVTNINDNTWINVIKEINNLRSKIC